MVAPTLRLLSGRPGGKASKPGYQQALREIQRYTDDAITDVGTEPSRTLSPARLLWGELDPTTDDAVRNGSYGL